MGRADGRVCGVHVLPSCARGAAGLKVDLLIQSLVIDLKHLAAEEPVFAFVPGSEVALAAPEHGSLPRQRQVLGPGFIIGTELQQDRLEAGDAGFSVCLSHLQQLAAYALRLTLPLYGCHRQGHSAAGIQSGRFRPTVAVVSSAALPVGFEGQHRAQPGNNLNQTGIDHIANHSRTFFVGLGRFVIQQCLVTADHPASQGGEVEIFTAELVRQAA